MNNCFKSPGLWALCLSFIAVTALECSYVLGGVRWLDALLVLLIPAFILLLIQILRSCPAGSKYYYAALGLVIACIFFSLFRLRGIEVGTVGDFYHVSKMVDLSIKNSFFSQIQYGDVTREAYISDFIESVWAIFWRWTHWDFIIVLLQALPIILLWQQLVLFFQIQKVKTFAGPLAAVVTLSLEILWCQLGSSYIDSIAGILIGITFLLCYSFLSPPYERRFFYLAGLIFVSGLCIVSKPTGICVGIFGSITAFVLGFRYLNTREKLFVPLLALPSLICIFYHQILVQIQKGSFFYPYVSANKSLHFFSGYYQIPISLRFPSWFANIAFHFKPLYVLISWLADYKLEPDISPDPFIRGNGLVFTYFVIPVLILWIFQHRNIFKTKLWKDPRLIIPGIIFIYYYSFEGSIQARFALGYNIFILAWCLSYLWQYLEQSRFRWLRSSSKVIVFLLLLMSFGSYFYSIPGNHWLTRGCHSIIKENYYAKIIK